MTDSTKQAAASNGADPAAAGTTPGDGLPAQLEVLKARALAAEKARDEYLDLAQRTKAEFENYQKRQQRDLATERRFALTPLAKDLLPAIDNLDRALAVARQAGDRGALAQGVGMVQTMLLDVLRRHGVTRMDPQGQAVNYDLHEAVMQKPTTEHPPGIVVEVFEPGYLIHARVLRPARVAVSAAPAGA